MPEKIPSKLKPQVKRVLIELKNQVPFHTDFKWDLPTTGGNFSAHKFYFDENSASKLLRDKFSSEMEKILLQHGFDPKKHSKLLGYLKKLVRSRLGHEIAKNCKFKKISFISSNGNHAIELEAHSGDIYIFKDNKAFLQKPSIGMEEIPITQRSHPQEFEKFREILANVQNLGDFKNYLGSSKINSIIWAANMYFSAHGKAKG